jgi:hypothetical protein
MGVKLRVGHAAALLIARQAARRVHELRGEQAARALPPQVAVDACAHELDVALGPANRPGHGLGVRGLDPRALIRRGDRPQRRDRLRRAERQVDPGDARAIAAGAA